MWWYEYKQEENYSMHEEKRSCWSTTYPSYEEYHVPPPTIHKMVTHPPSYYEPSDEEDNHNHDHDHDHNHNHMVVNDHGRWNRRDEDGRRGWDNNGTRYANNQGEIKKSKYQGGILRPPLGSVSHVPSHQYHPQGVYDPASRINPNHHHHHNNNKNRGVEDYPRKFPSNYGKVSRLEGDGNDDYVGVGGEDIESLIKKLQRDGRVKKIEVIEYERNIYKGAREEWRVVNGNGSGAPNYNYNSTNNAPFMGEENKS